MSFKLKEIAAQVPSFTVGLPTRGKIPGKVRLQHASGDTYARKELIRELITEKAGR